jgi:hypothetical protein
MIENSLARAVPVVLDFLASLLGLGGVGEKIRSVLEKVQAPVMKVVDWVVGKIVAAGKKILGKLKGKDKAAGKEAGAEAGGKAAGGGHEPVHETFDLEGKSHEIYDGPSGELMVASDDPQQVANLTELRGLYAQYRALPADADKKVREPVINAMIQLIRGNPGLVAKLNGTELGDPPNLGQIRRHSEQDARFRVPQGKESYAPLWEMESEHIVPGNLLSSLLVSRGLEKITEDEYASMHTILIYKGAASAKTRGRGADLSLLAKLRSRVKKGTLPGRPDRDNMLRTFNSLARGAASRAAAAVEAEYQSHKAERGTAAARPTADEIRQAAATQQTDIDAIIASRPPVPAAAAAAPAGGEQETG